MKNNPSSGDFYRNLPVLSEFNAFADLAGFHPAPDDWLIIIADIKNSTQSVKAGQYKQINMIGASCITAVLNTLDDIDIPFVFGGDGATMLIPSQYKNKVETALINVRALALKEFNIQLRIGFVEVSQVKKAQRQVLVAKYQISVGNCLAMFSGGGIELADHLIKDDKHCENYAVGEAHSSAPPDLTGLSCRWQPLKSSKGQMICLLIQAVDDNTNTRHQVLSKLLSQISLILDNNISNSNPVAEYALRFNWPPDGLKMEAILTKGHHSFLRRYLFLLYQSFVQSILERFDLKAGNYNAPEYKKELQSNSDYRRFDDTLRLVLDCSEAQINQITEMLELQYQNREIVYGVHKTDQAQMTCLVFSLEHHEHIHFIDGSDGGFWAAAVGYKKQLKNINHLPGNDALSPTDC